MSIKKIKFGCTPSLPAVYDESLSFLEAQGVVVKAVNDCIENVNELEGIVEGVTDDVEDLKSRMQTAEGDIDALEGRMDSAESDIDVLEETMQGVQSDISSLGERMGNAEGDIDALEGRMDTAEGDIDTLEGKMENAEGDIDALEGRVGTAEDDIDALESDVDDVEEVLDGIKDELWDSDTESGNPVVLDSALKQKAISTIISMLPIQAGSGDPSPSNVRPISGRTGVELTVKDSDNATVQDLTIQFGETVYGGTLDIESGVLIVDKKYAEFDGSENWLVYDTETYTTYQFFINDILQQTAVGQTSAYSNIAPYGVTVNTRQDYGLGCYVVNSGTGIAFQMYDAKSDFPTVDDWKAFLANMKANNTPVHAVYELATHITIQLTPEEVELVKGTNTVTTTGDEIQITYYTEPSAIDYLRSAVSSLGEVVGLISDEITAINERIGSTIAPSFTWSGTIAPSSNVNVGEFEFNTEEDDRQADVEICVELNVALESGASSMLVTIGLALNGVPDQYTYQTYVNDGYNVLTVNFKTSELLAGNYVGSVYISTNANGSV